MTSRIARSKLSFSRRRNASRPSCATVTRKLSPVRYSVSIWPSSASSSTSSRLGWVVVIKLLQFVVAHVCGVAANRTSTVRSIVVDLVKLSTRRVFTLQFFAAVVRGLTVPLGRQVTMKRFRRASARQYDNRALIFTELPHSLFGSL